MSRRIYLDHSATTYVRKEVMEEMTPYFCETFGNASSQHAFGREAMKGVDLARSRVAKAVGCTPSEVYFTSGGTESDIWALRGIANGHREKGRHIITSKIEHHAVLYNCKQLEKEGFSVTYLDVDADGIISLEQLKQAIRPDTILVSVMAANSEVGSLQPIAEIGAVCKQHGIVFHTDAVQALGAVELDVKKQNIDLLSLSAHKYYGPKGIGALYIRNGLKIDKHQIGGGQERNMRAGTHNTPGIVGMGKAVELISAEREENAKRFSAMRDELIRRIEAEIPYVKLNGSRTKRLPNNVNISFRYIEGESILLLLDTKGIAVSTGSACSSGSLEPSHVLLSMGLDSGTAHGSIRFTFGKCNTMEDVADTADAVKEVVMRLRQLSPLMKKENEHV